jgi:hypothetical protein
VTWWVLLDAAAYTLVIAGALAAAALAMGLLGWSVLVLCNLLLPARHPLKADWPWLLALPWIGVLKPVLRFMGEIVAGLVEAKRRLLRELLGAAGRFL